MMGRSISEGPATDGSAVPRGTLPVLDWIRNYGFDVALGVDNVGNAFTPMGCADPLGMISGVGVVYQGGSQADCKLLLVGLVIFVLFENPMLMDMHVLCRSASPHGQRLLLVIYRRVIVTRSMMMD